MACLPLGGEHRLHFAVPAPWIIKPRQEAASMGIKVMHNVQEVWKKIMELGDKQSGYLLEKYSRHPRRTRP